MVIFIFVLFCLSQISEADAILTKVKLGVELTQENVAQDPELGANVAEGGDTAVVFALVVGLDVDRRWKVEVGASEVEGDHRQRVHGGAGDVPLALDVNGANQLINLGVGIGGNNNQGGAGVGNSLDWSGHYSAVPGDLVDGKLPVALLGDGHVGEVTINEVVIGAAQGQLSALVGGAVPGQVETENWLVDEALLVQVVERRHYIVDGDLLEAHAQNAIELHVGEAAARLGDGFSESLTGNGQAVDGDRIGGQIALHTASSVLDGEVLVHGNEGGGGTGVVLIMLLAGHVGGQALDRGNPQVGRASIEHHVEVLGRRADTNLAIVVHVHRVAQLLVGVVTVLVGVIVAVVIVVEGFSHQVAEFVLQDVDGHLLGDVARHMVALLGLGLVDFDAVDLSTDHGQDNQKNQTLEHFD